MKLWIKAVCCKQEIFYIEIIQMLEFFLSYVDSLFGSWQTDCRCVDKQLRIVRILEVERAVGRRRLFAQIAAGQNDACVSLDLVHT